MDRNTRRLLFVLAAVVILTVVVLVIRPGVPAAPLKPLPNPNGYTDLVKAGDMVTGQVPNYEEMDRAQLRALIELNTNALALARAGLQEECRVPLLPSQEFRSNYVAGLSALKRMAQALVAEGKLAELEDRPGDAAKSYLDVVRLGTESARGGTLIDALVGTAIEALGTSRLQKLGDRLDATTCRETAAALETLDLQRQPWADVLEQERAWSRQAFRSFADRLTAFITSGSLKTAADKAEKKFREQQLKTRRLMIDLAVRAYELEAGRRPSSLPDLVPQYLKAIPLDPFTGTNLVYSP